MLVGIIGALDHEINGLKALMENSETDIVSSVEFYRGAINGADIVLAAAGVGKVNAAVCAQTMILKYSPDIIINIGAAGGLSKELGIGDIAIAEAVVEHDMDTTPTGEPLGYIYGLERVEMPCSKKLTDMLEETVHMVGTVKSQRGVIASGDQFICTDEQRNKIIDNFGAVAAEMEGGSIGHVCMMNGVPFGVLRAISDGANDDAVMDYPTFAQMAADNSIKIMVELLKKMKGVSFDGEN